VKGKVKLPSSSRAIAYLQVDVAVSVGILLKTLAAGLTQLPTLPGELEGIAGVKRQGHTPKRKGTNLFRVKGNAASETDPVRSGVPHPGQSHKSCGKRNAPGSWAV
jgi:hypothetical protein